MTTTGTAISKCDMGHGAPDHILVQDFCNSVMCIQDPGMKGTAIKAVSIAMKAIAHAMDNAPGTVHLWVDASFNPCTGMSGMGLITVMDPEAPMGENGNACFGKTLPRMGSSVKAEVCALGTALSYMMDRYPDVRAIRVHYDCTDAIPSARDSAAYLHLGAPYTNYHSALKRLRKAGVNVAFEHVKAHAGDGNNESCDAIARHFSGASMAGECRSRWKAIKPFVHDGSRHRKKQSGNRKGGDA